MPLGTQQRLTDHLVKWNGKLQEHRTAGRTFGELKADLEHERAKLILQAKSEEPKLSQAAAESLADADDRIWRMDRQFRVVEQELTNSSKYLDWYRAVADALRSEVATERAEAQLYSSDRSTP